MLDLVSTVLSQASDWLGVTDVQKPPVVRSERLQGVLKVLLDGLEEIASHHPEIYDSEVGERMSDSLVRHYVKGAKRAKLASTFGMFSEEGNAKVREALQRYISQARKIADEEGIKDPESRLSTIQDDSVVSASKGDCYDAFFGHVDSL